VSAFCKCECARSRAVQELFKSCSRAVQELFKSCSSAVQVLFKCCSSAVQELKQCKGWGKVVPSGENEWKGWGK